MGVVVGVAVGFVEVGGEQGVPEGVVLGGRGGEEIGEVGCHSLGGFSLVGWMFGEVLEGGWLSWEVLGGCDNGLVFGKGWQAGFDAAAG